MLNEILSLIDNSQLQTKHVWSIIEAINTAKRSSQKKIRQVTSNV